MITNIRTRYDFQGTETLFPVFVTISYFRIIPRLYSLKCDYSVDKWLGDILNSSSLQSIPC